MWQNFVVGGTTMIALYIALGIVGFLLLVWFVFEFNKFIVLKNKVDKELSNMDVFFKKRYDLIPNLVNTVKGYMKHEQSLIEEVTKARASASPSFRGEKRAKAEARLGGAVDNLFAVAENYPDLKANTVFLDLQTQLSAMENQIASAREQYNSVATELNTKRESFPASIVAFLMGLKKRTLFKARRRERKNVKVKF